MSVRYLIGDTYERVRELPDASVDLLVTSPPFLALRSYLPPDHPDKHREIGSEATPADFLDTLLNLTAEWGRVLAPHGSLCVELGDTYSGSKAQDDGVTIDYHRPNPYGSATITRTRSAHDKRGAGWPLAKSLTGIPTLYTWSLAYGRNLLTGEPSPAGQWRIRNVIVWARPNPSPGALGDKFRPATSYITVATRAQRRYFDIDAVRQPLADSPGNVYPRKQVQNDIDRGAVGGNKQTNAVVLPNPGGAPPLDWHADDHPADGDWLWRLSTQPYKGSHYATYPLTLPKRLIEAMCPQRVCRTCGKPSERIAVTTNAVGHAALRSSWHQGADPRDSRRDEHHDINKVAPDRAERQTLGWTDCGHDDWRTGVVLDPFAGTGTTLEAAQLLGRHAIGIDLDARNAELARQRVGMFLDIDGEAA